MKAFWKWFLTVIFMLILIAGALDLAVGYLVFNFAFGRTGLTSFYNQDAAPDDTAYFQQNNAQRLQETTKDETKLVAYYVPAAKPTKKTVVVIHGYGSNALQMSSFIKIFHNNGVNVLAPDNRGFGESSGKYVGYGLKDVPDLVDWVKTINQKNPHGQIGLFGTSMGGSEVLFALPQMPKNVKFAIVDSAYSSIAGELTDQINMLFKVPSWLVLPATNLFVQQKAGYNIYDGNSKKTLKNNHIPLFIIQGTGDQFVPAKNAKTIANNDPGYKKVWMIPNAKHIESRSLNPQLYTQKVTMFMNRFFK